MNRLLRKLCLSFFSLLLICASPAMGLMGKASWYGDPTSRTDTFHGRMTASGEKYNTFCNMGFGYGTAAHKTLPFGSLVRLTRKNKSFIVQINDRGPYVDGRDFDVCWWVARRLDMLRCGECDVSYEVIRYGGRIGKSRRSNQTKSRGKTKAN